MHRDCQSCVIFSKIIAGRVMSNPFRFEVTNGCLLPHSGPDSMPVTQRMLIPSSMPQSRCITIYFEVLHGYKRFCCIRYTASTNSAYQSILYLYTQTNHVCYFITLNYTSMNHCVGIYQGTVAFYSDLTRITVSVIKSEWI